MQRPPFRLMEMIDAPITFVHLLWHFIFNIFLIVDGLLGILSLGLRHPSFTQWITYGGLNFLYDHQAAQDEENKRRVAEELGINPDMLVEIKDEDAIKLVQARMAQILEAQEVDKKKNPPTIH